MSRPLVAFLAVVCLSFAAPARAQDAAPDETEGRALFQAGTVAYEAGRYEAALSRYQEAYALTHRPVILWSIALAADRARQDALALETYRRFLAENPDDPTTHDIRVRALARVDVLEAQVAEARAAAARVEQAHQAELDAEAARERAELEAQTAREDAELARTQARDAADSSRVTNKWWFWTAISVGVVSAVVIPVAVVHGRQSTSRFPDTDHGSVIFAVSGRF